MTDDLNTLEEEIEADRDRLDRSFGKLEEALSPERLTDALSREFEERGGAVAKAATDAAKANPTAALLVTAGLAALVLGQRKPEPEPTYATDRVASAPGRLQGNVLHGEFDRRVAAASQAEPRAPKLRKAINSGLANLPEPARKRVIAAREAAIDMQEDLDRRAQAAARKAKSFHHRQPLSTGAFAFGIGAIAAALLPRTRLEDGFLGERRDALMQQAELVLRDEIARATETGEAALREGLQAGRERLRNH